MNTSIAVVGHSLDCYHIRRQESGESGAHSPCASYVYVTHIACRLFRFKARFFFVSAGKCFTDWGRLGRLGRSGDSVGLTYPLKTKTPPVPSVDLRP